MTNKISQKEVEKTAALAKLSLSNSEIDKFSQQLAAVLDNFSSVDEVKTKEVDIAAQVTGLEDVLAADEEEMKIAVNQNELLKNAPRQEDGYIIVPKVL